MILPPDTRSVCSSFLQDLMEILDHDLIGVYLYGALTFADSREQVQDLDFHVVLRHPFDEDQRQQIGGMHQRLAGDFPPLGGELDGYYLTLADISNIAPPPTEMWPLWRAPSDSAWALHCAHIRAGQVIVLYGPDPLMIYPSPTWPALAAALYDEIRFVQEHLDDAPAYCILNACRLVASFESKNVVLSKRAAADAALKRLPEQWHGLIQAALRSYEGSATVEDETSMRSETHAFVEVMWKQIADRR